MRAPTTGRRSRRHPAVTVDVVVVTAHVARDVLSACIWVIGWDIPFEARHPDRCVEAQVLRRVVHPAGTVEPDALQVERHVDFVARIGIEAVDPQFVVGRVDSLHPDLVNQHVGFDFVIVPAVDHHLLLCVEVLYCALSLLKGEVAD